jgi:4-diphosphocytidyl-2-C-methyl-D-erythritol kinase
MGVARLSAPAKLTLSLRVEGRRPDGYHELTAEMVSLDLADTLLVDSAAAGLEVEVADNAGASELVGGPDNLVSRALVAVGRTAGVHLRKRIPVGGGLGGGSSDAAAVLRWAGCTDPAVAAALGADVPFCVVGGRAEVTGIGEGVSPLAFEPRAFVLLVPPFGVDTAAVYRAWDSLGSGPAQGRNDLTASALVVEPRLARWRDLLEEVTGRQPVLAGSGSTWFVEGTVVDLGLEDRSFLALEGERGHLIGARTVPAGWGAVTDA